MGYAFLALAPDEVRLSAINPHPHLAPGFECTVFAQPMLRVYRRRVEKEKSCLKDTNSGMVGEGCNTIQHTVRIDAPSVVRMGESMLGLQSYCSCGEDVRKHKRIAELSVVRM
jgi:hypothetical protein